MLAVSGAESIVHINISVGSEFLGELFLLLFHLFLGSLVCGIGFVDANRLALLLGIETEVFKQEDFSGLEIGGSLCGISAVGSELHVAAESLGHSVLDLNQGKLGIDLAFGLAHM